MVDFSGRKEGTAHNSTHTHMSMETSPRGGKRSRVVIVDGEGDPEGSPTDAKEPEPVEAPQQAEVVVRHPATSGNQLSVNTASTALVFAAAARSRARSEKTQLRKPLAQDRTVMDQRLFYRTLGKPTRVEEAPRVPEGGATRVSVAAEDTLDSSGAVVCSWASQFSQVDGRTYLDLGAALPGVAEGGSEVCFSLPSGLGEGVPTPPTVEVADTTSLLFIRACRDFYRSGVRFKRRNGLGSVARSSAADASADVLSATSEALSISSDSVSPSTAPTTSILRMKIRSVEAELETMQRTRRQSSSDEVLGNASSLGSSVSPTLSNSGRSPKRRGTRLDSMAFSGRRRSALDFILQGASPTRRKSSNAAGGNNSDDDSEDENVSAESIPDRQLVDRFTGASLEAVSALSRKLLMQPSVRLQGIRVLNLTGSRIGDDGCFVVLQSIRFGPLKGVQCLDLMYNQLTVRSTFYMGVFLLLRPPLTLVESETNAALRAAYDEANVPVDPRQQALSLIAAKRASQRGGGGSSANRQGPPFFLPLFESWKSLVQEFFSKRKVLAAIVSTTPQSNPSPLTNLRNVVHATLLLNALRPKPAERTAAAPAQPFAFSSTAVPVVDEDAFVGADSDDEEDKQHEEELEELLHSLHSPRGHGAESAPASRSAFERRAGAAHAEDQQSQRQLRELQEKELHNAATDIVSLRMGWNDLEDEGILMLSEWLAVQTFLLELNVSYNDGTDVGFTALRDALRSTTSLISLNTEGNVMEDATAEVMRGALLYNRRLHTKHSEGP